MKIFVAGHRGMVGSAIAKIAGIKLCESYNRQYGTDYRSVMPTNL
jgi:nucleoside-diphosphate-sugar epimerase